MNSREVLTDRIFAMFALGAIGDALGAPVEMMSAEAIAKRYGWLKAFVERKEHKFGPIAKGETTDDTQLKLAIARSIARMRGIDHGDIAKEHIAEMRKVTRGWGGSTRQAVERLFEGVHWSASGSTPDTPSDKRGKGNGVAMKIDPVGAYYALRGVDPMMNWEHRAAVRDIALMTHASAMGVASGLAQVAAVRYLLGTTVVNSEEFAERVTSAAFSGERVFMPITALDERVDEMMDAGLLGGRILSTAAFDDDRLSERFRLLGSVTRETSDETLRSTFGNGACYVYESLPLAYALFLRKPDSVEALYDAVNFGGDTDTVASIVGSLLGAYNGSAIIPWELWADIDRQEEIDATVDEFVRALTV
ncbi:MAG: hypothetical protein A3C93_00250 [Candidatus Lloydbacteria bacterium RIFCSPHIGHO2_02_FULL_54_17]|uniref:ADP-ribosylglycohydrolase n=1 Tax=Candidatus Lloydbacteria bacterium RIFCSPHIGHO2_02_FULL_54_17 TaxID=1798664 RepID=A0A1G2DI25_9BACT|nr:MAG: hypothetical protein A2762_04000 [Candidatus Lloydbacteria bacterium RIFCSPHIGHO2_01_FULL_54_11]OGZ13334.1 MAG: hypothetical protein A3C93_00250 [Candidatus Lloydbacteria bacterium RIFCSPHIGHO2_02_FULL_54_17]OGZ17142.1 MAG: hypothetical protein A3H76_03050 [Candidatus Lloydbacteria bacterium RIFCSPLOWO2_02_FULL_54_12]